MAHFIKQCKHGVVHSRCRCIGPHSVTLVPCMVNYEGTPIHGACKGRDDLTILDELREAGEDYDDVLFDYGLMKPLKHEILRQGRWSLRVREIYVFDDLYFAVEYDQPATEYQEGQEKNPEFYEVQAVQKTITDYIPIPKAL